MLSKHITNLLLVLVSLVGLGLILYPTMSDMWNSRYTSRQVANYSETVASITEEDYGQYWLEARDYNKKVSALAKHDLSDEMRDEYERVLDVGGNGIMGYIEIPRINVLLPLYHGTESEVLQIAIGHVEWSSLPIGGLGTHCVVSGHRGLPSAKLFTDLPQLERGDVFYIRVLNELMTYEVDQILTVFPYELDDLSIDPDKDYCTLVTCTPYGLNTHRLLVRGHRIANAEEARIVLVTADAVRIEPLVVVPIIAAPMVLLLVAFVMLTSRGSDDRRGYKGVRR